jgi:hypothetical protein
MAWLAREGTVRRVVDGARRGRAPIVLGGPGMGRTTTVQAAAERLRAQGIEVAIVELGDDAAEVGLAPAGARVVLRTGGVDLHRALSRSRSLPQLDGRTLQRVPLVPLLRRDCRAWAAAEGFALAEDELERAFRSCGGHPTVFSLWLAAQRATGSPQAREERALRDAAPLFARIDRALAQPELAKPWSWLALRGAASVEELRRATGATKPALDRLAIAGPVSRTLGARAEIAATCALYLRHCGATTRR